MVDLSSFTSSFTGMGEMFKSGIFWTVGAIVIIGIIFFFYGMMQKRSRLKYNCIELVNFGNGKIGSNLMKAGVFGTRTFMNLGIYDYGAEKVIKVSDGRRILDATTDDLHDIMGKRGFIVRRKDDDPKILVPITKVGFKNEQLLFEIAPSDYRDASVRILDDAVKETQGTWEKILPYIAIGLIVVLTIVSIIINQQMTNNTVDKVGKMLIQGCSNSQSAVAGASP
jgi:hypothetical protein